MAPTCTPRFKCFQILFELGGLSLSSVPTVKVKIALAGESSSCDPVVRLMDSDSNERIEGLEASITHLEHQYDQLNQVVVEQGKEIARLLQQLQKTSSTLESIEMERIKSNNQKPPHSVI